MDLATFRAAVSRLIRDGAGVLQSADLDFAVTEAVKRYSRAKPRVVVADVAGDGGFDYDLPAEWDAATSSLLRVEYPAGQRTPVYVDELDLFIYTSPAGPKLRFLATTPQAGLTIRLTFTAPHTVDAASCTVPAGDHDAINLVAAALACESLASHYTNAGDSTIGADAVDHRSKASEYAARAKRFMQMANELLPIQEQGEVKAASAQTSWGDAADFLTHPER